MHQPDHQPQDPVYQAHYHQLLLQLALDRAQLPHFGLVFLSLLPSSILHHPGYLPTIHRVQPGPSAKERLRLEAEAEVVEARQNRWALEAAVAAAEVEVQHLKVVAGLSQVAVEGEQVRCSTVEEAAAEVHCSLVGEEVVEEVRLLLVKAEAVELHLLVLMGQDEMRKEVMVVVRCAPDAVGAALVLQQSSGVEVVVR